MEKNSFIAIFIMQASLSFEFRMGKSTVCGIIKDLCEALWNALSPEYVKMPSNEREWLSVNVQYEKMWIFPNCIGTINGKHVVIQAPKCVGSSHFNYKGAHSIALLAVCDTHYRFIMIDVGDAGCHRDGGVLFNSNFERALQDNLLPLPPDRPLPDTSSPAVPYIFVGDEAFSLRQNMMRPFPGKHLTQPQSVYNYRLSRARLVIENSFDILASRWRIFRRLSLQIPKMLLLPLSQLLHYIIFFVQQIHLCTVLQVF